MRAIKLILCAFFVFVPLFPNYVYCNEQKTLTVESIFKLSLEELMNIQVVTPSKAKGALENAPSSITVFTREEIKSMGITDVYELLNYVPGFQVIREVSDGSTKEILVRGSSKGDINNHVLFLLNGQRLNDDQTGGVTARTRFLTTGHIKRVEVIRGPGSAIYGSNAFMGVVNMITETELTEVSINTGSFGHKSASAITSTGNAEYNFSLYADFYSDEGEGYDVGVGHDVYDPQHGENIYTTFKFKEFELNAFYYQNTYEDFFQEGRLGNKVNQDKTRKIGIDTSHNWKVSNKIKLTTTLAYTEGKREMMLIRRPAGTDIGQGPIPTDWLGGPSTEYSAMQISTDMNYAINTNDALAVGIMYRYSGNDDVEVFTNYANLNVIPHRIGPIPDWYIGEVVPVSTDITEILEEHLNIWGIYAEYKKQLGDDLTTFLGARYDEHDDFGNTTNPRCGIIYDATFDAIFKLLYGKAFRAPTLNELINGRNPDLEPETIETIELVYIQKIGKIINTSLTYFYNDVEDIIITLASGTVERVENGGEADIRGIEYEVTATPVKELLMRVTYTHIFSDTSPNAFEKSGSIVLNYHKEDWNFNINGIYRDKMDALLQQQGSYFLFNTKFSYRVTNNVTANVAIKNVFDEDYDTYGFQLQQFNYEVPNRGREWRIGVEVGL
jgi:outer membrane receptor for ferrienterochelin and colicins